MKTESGRKSGDDEKIKVVNEEESRKDEDKDAARKGKGQDEDKGKAEENKEPEIDQEKVDRTLADLRQTAQEAATNSGRKTKSSQSRQQFETLGDENVEVLKTEDKYYVAGVRSLDKSSLKKLFSAKGIDKDIEFPSDWDKKSTEAKTKFLKQQGVMVITAMPGGAGEEDQLKWLEKLPDASKAPAEVAKYISEIEKLGRSERPDANKLNALSNIDQNLVDAILKGEIDGSSAEVARVQEALSEGISSTAAGAMRESPEAAMAAGYGRRGREGFTRDSEFEVPTKEAADSLFSLAREGKTTGAEWDEALKNVHDRISEIEKLAEAPVPNDYKKAHFFAKGIQDSIEGDKSAFEKLPEEVKSKLESARMFLKDLDAKFQRILNGKTKQEQHKLIGDIDSDAAIYLKQISAGWGETIDTAKGALLRKIGDDAATKDIREWRVLKSMDSLEEAVRVRQLTEPPVIWREVPEKLKSVYSQMESTDFSVEELQVVTNEAIQLVRSITPDDPEGRKLRDQLVDELEAFRAFHSMRITMERNDMNPERMLEIFQTYFDDDTWMHFAERFSKDARAREFVVLKKGEDGKYIDENGNPTDHESLAVETEKVNLFDIAFSQYSERLRRDRINMNIVEQLTKRAIGNSLSDAQIREIAKSMNHKFDDDFRNRVEGLRQYFFEKTEEAIKNTAALRGSSVDDVWGRKRLINGVESLKGPFGFNHMLIQNWHQKETLQGAFGMVGEGDIADLVKSKGMDPTNKDLVDEARKKYLNKTYLAVRREEMTDALGKELEEQGVKVELKDGSTIDASLDDLRQSGFINSVDSNAYYTSWMFEWSNYDSIRIYSRDTTSGLDDDFEGLVFHQDTHMFYGRHIDHIWEFFHDSNENRGRAKENDVNRLWKQYLPGKHKYLFPQNSLMVRWTEHFMSQEQKEDLNIRTKEAMKNWDFDNKKYHDEFVGWMRTAMMMDMIENGEVAMSAVDNRRKFSQVVKEGRIKKFEMIDVFADRNKHIKYAGTDAFQAYLANPTNERFIELNDKTKTFYSTRAARQFPWMTLAFRAHWEVNSRHRRRLFDTENLTAVAGEHVVEALQARGDMERKQVEHEKRKLFGFKSMTLGGAMGVPKVAQFETPGAFGAMLGTTPFRRIRQTLEFGRKTAWEGKHVPLVLPLFFFFGAIWGGFTEFLKQGVRQTSGGQR